MIKYSFEFNNPHNAAGANNFTPIFTLSNIVKGYLVYMKCHYSFFDGTDSREIHGSVTLRLPSSPLGQVADQVILGTGTVIRNQGNPFCSSHNDFVARHEVVMGQQFYAMDCTYQFPVNYVIPIGGGVFVNVKIYIGIEEDRPEDNKLRTVDPAEVLTHVLHERT